MACRYFLGDKELKGDELTSYMKNLPHETKLKVAPEIAKDSYSRLSWTPGEAQAARYDLSKTFKSIEASKLPDGTYNIGGTRDGGFQQLQSKVPESKLPEVVGKELADKIIKKNLAVDKAHTFDGVDLKIGGEGMKGFYDQIIPKALEKISGEKVKTANISGKENNAYNGPSKTIDDLIKLHDDQSLSRRDQIKLGDVIADMSTGSNFKEAMTEHATDYLAAHLGGEIKPVANKQSIHYIDIPQSLKDKALGKGFPLFSSTHIFTPVSHDPFEKKKK